MSTLLWPGDHRAGSLMSDAALVEAMVAVEQAWLDALVATGVAPESASRHRLSADSRSEASVSADSALDPAEVEAGGNPVIPLVRALRAALPDHAAPWVHRGLTSQDVLDTALVLCARDAVEAVRRELGDQITLLVALAEEHRETAMLARTLTQPALPTTFGAKAATWLHAVLDADDALAALRWPVQLGGAAGTLAAPVELAGVEGGRQLRGLIAAGLDLDGGAPWHTRRTTVTALGDAAVTATDGWGRIANDVLALGRPEIGELRDGSAGGSSAMPHKANPTLAVLVRRAALAGPPLASTLHLAAAAQVDERADGGWHVEWQTLALLLRRTVVAAAQTTGLLRGLGVDTDRMAAHLAAFEDDLLAEQRSVAAVTGRPPAATYRGLVDDLIDEALVRARTRLKEHP
ncbi:lyase family protein [Nocardioides sp. YIM 152588]|uniref:lyase family protein n=1 Tax=Nocardioides sp. YIM 152588 TaxID=3158259 RepID=UPI0032E3C81D